MSDSHTLTAPYRSVTKLPTTFEKLDSLHGDVHGNGGIEEWLQEQTAHANDQDSSIVDAKDENRKLPKEIARMKATSFVSSGDWNPSTKKSSTSKVSLCART